MGVLLDTQRDALLAAARLVTDGRVASVVLVGRGSSDHAAIYGQYLVEMVLGRPAGLATPSVTSLLGRDLFDSSTLVVAVSQSGSSPDLVATVESARRSGSPTLSLTNDPASELARAADVHIDLCAGPELSVAATKSYTAELVALHAWVRLAAGEPYDDVRDDIALGAAAAEGRGRALGGRGSRNRGRARGRGPGARDRAGLLAGDGQGGCPQADRDLRPRRIRLECGRCEARAARTGGHRHPGVPARDGRVRP